MNTEPGNASGTGSYKRLRDKLRQGSEQGLTAVRGR